MPSIYSIMDISRWALQASTRQLDTVSHNVANVNTEGYSRQSVVLETATPEWTSEGMYGHGVSVSTVIQYVDKLLLARITDKASDLSYYDSMLSQLSRLESLCNEAGDNSLGAELTAFFSAWSDLANNPESTAVREALAETANNLISRFQTISQDLTLVSRDMDGYIASGVDEINSMCRQISQLNGEIQAAEASGDTANDYRDQRQLLIEQLSGKIDINWFEDANGAVSIYCGQGKTLVQGSYPDDDDADPLSFTTVAGYDGYQLVWQQQNLVMDSDEVTGGEMGAWLQMRDVEIPAMQEFMNDLAKTLIGQVNILHSSGAGLDEFTQVTGSYETNSSTLAFNDNANTLAFKDLITTGTFDIWAYVNGTQQKVTVNVSASNSLSNLVDNINTALTAAGINMTASVTSDNKLAIANTDGATTFAFANDTSNVLAALGVNTFFDGYSATSIGLADPIEEDVRNIAAGRLLDTGEHALGDNSNALDLADLKDAETMNNGTQTFNEAVISWASALGTDVATTTDNLAFSTTTANELLDLRDGVSAVSIDEEMVKMIQYQRAYQMAAKMISMADELLTTLLQIKG